MSELTPRWQLPAVTGPLFSSQGRASTLAEIAREQGDPYARGFARGHAEGLARAATELEQRERELQQRVAQWDAIMRSLARPLEQCNQEVEMEIVRLAAMIGKHLCRRELTLDPAQIIAIVRDALAALPLGARLVNVHLHPADAAIVRERLSEMGADASWRIVEDAVLARGGCKISAEHSRVDATLEARTAMAVASLERQRSDPLASDEAAGPGS
jgi:flagellar assembly protein FliH